MSNTATVVALINGGLSVAVNALLATQKYQTIVESARAQGREVTDQELADVRASNKQLTDDLLSNLE